MRYRVSDRMSDRNYQTMLLIFKISDFLFPYVDRRARSFGLTPGMVVVDYGCGPGRYATRFAELVGSRGKVYAVDIHELGIAAVTRAAGKQGLANLVPVLAHGYDSGLPSGLADRVFALDMFFSVKDPTALLSELKRLLKPDGLLVLDDGHQSRQTTRAKLDAAGLFEIVEETSDHLKLKPATGS